MKNLSALEKLKTRKSAHYISAIVLGFNDALVELTGALAGFTIALQNNRLIILAGITTGVAATLSMAAAEFLSKEADDVKVSSFISAACTGLAYLFTVGILLIPYFICETPPVSLCICLLLAALMIFVFTWTLSKIRGTPFLKDFKKMLIISFGVAFVAFAISWAANILWGVNI